MPLNEEHDHRRLADRLYSTWHRPDHISRFVDPAEADRLALIDIDQIHTLVGLIDSGATWAECTDGFTPVALIETVLWNAQKSVTMLCKLANRRVPIPAYLVRIVPTPGLDDIEQFSVRQVAPRRWGEPRLMTPPEYADFVRGLRGGRR
jgi:hypothetical protein